MLCECCKLIQIETPISITDKRPPICKECAKHLSRGKAEQRDREHLTWWKQNGDHLQGELSKAKRIISEEKQQAERERIKYSTELTHLQNVISAAYANGVDDDLVNLIQSREVRKAEEARDSAFRNRDFAFSVLLGVERVHHAVVGKPNRCVCGVASKDCRVVQAMSEILVTLDKWEEKQVRRSTKGKSNFLPPWHENYDERTSLIEMNGAYYEGAYLTNQAISKAKRENRRMR